MKPTTIEAYIAQYEGQPAAAWLRRFADYMQHTYPYIPGVIAYQVPLYRFGGIEVGFWAAKKHFSFHTTAFDMLEELKAQLSPNATYSKSCARVSYDDEATIPVLLAMVDRIVAAYGEGEA